MIKCQYVPRIKDEEFTPCLTMPAENKLEAGCKFASQLIPICLAFSALFLLGEMQRCDSPGGPRLHGSPQAPEPVGSWSLLLHAPCLNSLWSSCSTVLCSFQAISLSCNFSRWGNLPPISKGQCSSGRVNGVMFINPCTLFL